MMNTPTILQPLTIPTCKRCCCCLKLKEAVAWTINEVYTFEGNRYRVYCQPCALQRGFKPSKNLQSKTLDESGVKQMKCDCPKRKYTKKRSA
jgi:hypothetical protein